ncbi:MAG: hypothetical protein Q4G70_00365 [Pseudomonadota bacterium]|nr:hypothetical protein [Pseudomonadota bacterium]
MRSLSLIPVLAMAAALTACGGGDDKPSTPDTQTPATTTQAAESYAGTYRSQCEGTPVQVASTKAKLEHYVEYKMTPLNANQLRMELRQIFFAIGTQCNGTPVGELVSNNPDNTITLKGQKTATLSGQMVTAHKAIGIERPIGGSHVVSPAGYVTLNDLEIPGDYFTVDETDKGILFLQGNRLYLNFDNTPLDAEGYPTTFTDRYIIRQ